MQWIRVVSDPDPKRCFEPYTCKNLQNDAHFLAIFRKEDHNIEHLGRYFYLIFFLFTLTKSSWASTNSLLERRTHVCGVRGLFAGMLWTLIHSVLACSRGLLSWSCRLIEACKSGLMQSDNGPETIQSVLEFSWSHLEHSIDSVRHNAREFIKNSLTGLQLLNSEESCGVVDRFLGQSLALPAHKRARFASLSCLVKTGSLPMMLKVSKILTEIQLFRCGAYL